MDAEEFATTLALPVTEPRRFSNLPIIGQTLEFISARLGPNEIRRRFWHMLPGLLPISWWFVAHSDPLSFGWESLLGLESVCICLGACYSGHRLMRHGEWCCLQSFMGYAITVLIPFLLFPSQAEIGVATLAVVAFGDGSAALWGMLLGGRKLPWNEKKTWTGFTFFLLGSVPVATLYYWMEARPHVPFSWALLAGSTAGLAGVFAESVPSKINDNIRVGLAAMTAMFLVNTLVLGWH